MHCINWGLILSGILVLISLMIYIFAIDPTSIGVSVLVQLISVVSITWIMAYASISYRNKFLDNKISFLRCLLAGLIVGIMANLVVSLYSYLFNAFFDPEYAGKIMEMAIEKIESNPNIPDDMKSEIIAKMADVPSPLKQLGQTLMMYGIMNSVLALIATLFVRKKEKIKETNIF